MNIIRVKTCMFMNYKMKNHDFTFYRWVNQETAVTTDLSAGPA